MSKRKADDCERANKKIKENVDLDDFWGDDLDDDVLDNCFNLATQICKQEKNENEASILPSYNAFKNPNTLISSTQNGFQASCSSKNLEVGLKVKTEVGKHRNEDLSEDLELNLRRLQDKYKEKEGEVSILREQIKEIRTNNQLELARKNGEWSEKLHETKKEIESIRTQLQFKNLEIVNLKQKVTEVTKFRDLSCTQVESQLKLPSKDAVYEKCEYNVPSSYVLQGYTEKFFPLRDTFCLDIFKNVGPEKYISGTSSSKNAISYLQNQISEDKNLCPVLRYTLVDNKPLGLHYILPEIAKLIDFAQEELNMTESNELIEKVLCVSIQLLSDLLDFLKELLASYSNEDIQQLETDYLNKTLRSDTEIGKHAGYVLKFLGDILPFNDFLAHTLLLNKSVSWKDQYLSTFPCLRRYRNTPFLNLLLELVVFIRKIRSAHIFPTFLSCAISFLKQLSYSPHLNNVYDVYGKIINELLFARPNAAVMFEMMDFFKVASRSPKFLDLLCQKPNQITFSAVKAKGLLYFNHGSCTFPLFLSLFNNNLLNIEDKDRIIKITLNVLVFIYNSFVSNSKWLHYQEKHQCGCLENFYQLGISVIYNFVKLYKEVDNIHHEEPCGEIFKMIIKILKLMAFNSFELIERYVAEFSKFKDVCTQLYFLKDSLGLSESDIYDLQKLNISEDIPCISPEALSDL